MSAFWAFSHSAPYRSGATRTSKCSTVGYVGREAALRTLDYAPRSRTRSKSLPLNHAIHEILKTFPEMLKGFGAKVLTSKVNKWYNLKTYTD